MALTTRKVLIGAAIIAATIGTGVTQNHGGYTGSKPAADKRPALESKASVMPPHNSWSEEWYDVHNAISIDAPETVPSF